MTLKSGRHIFKIAICGSGGVGKTSLFNRYISNTFQAEQLMTIGMNYATHYLDTLRGRVDLQIWDFGGQLKFRPLLFKFLEGTNGALLLFDLTSFSSFVDLGEWYAILGKELPEKIPIILVGNKLDLCERIPTEQVVPDNEVQKYVQDRKSLNFIKTSAKTGENVKLCFESIVECLMDTKSRSKT